MRRLPLLVAIYVPALLVLGAAVVVSVWRDIPMSTFMRDAQVAIYPDVPFYAGAISNVGLMMWGVAAVSCTFAGLLLRKRGDDDGWSTFLIASGVLNAALLLDDCFMGHDQALRGYLRIPEKVTFLVGGLIVFGFLAVFFKRILRTDYVLLGLAFFFFMISVGMDLKVHDEIMIGEDFKARHLFEDGTKFLGIVTWSVYFTRTAWSLVQPPVNS